MPEPPIGDPRFIGAIELLRRTGLQEFQIRYSDDEKPTVWMAVGRWKTRWEAAGAIHPITAIFRLCEAAVDGGMCTHCHRPTGFIPDDDTMPFGAADIVCWYQWNPEGKTFQRGCINTPERTE